MAESFLAFHLNAVNNILYILQSNYWFILMLIGVLGSVVLNLKADIDSAVSEEQNII